jgi:hypothetical protein
MPANDSTTIQCNGKKQAKAFVPSAVQHGSERQSILRWLPQLPSRPIQQPSTVDNVLLQLSLRPIPRQLGANGM